MGKGKEDKTELTAATDASHKEVVHPPVSEVQSSCHDLLFAALFLLAFGFTIGLAIMYGQDVLSGTTSITGDGSSTGDASISLITGSDGSDGSDALSETISLLKQKQAKYKYALRISAVIAVGALFASLLWTGVMLVCGKMLIWISVIAICAISMACGFVSSSFLKDEGDSAYWWPALVATIFTLLVMLYICCIRSRIAFASANLQVACKAVLSYPVIMITAIIFTLVQIGWALVWSLATYAAITHGEYVGEGEDYSAGKKFGVLVGMLLVFFWATFVCRNIVMVATAGTVSSWWHHSSQDRQAMTTTRALLRALTLSFGSICFGSLIVSIIQTIRFILASLQHTLEKQGNAVAACLVGCIGCLVACIQTWVEYFNRFAYAYVGIYGYSFISSGKRVCQLFASKGWSAIANDSLISNVLFFGKIVVGFLGAAAGWGAVVYGDSAWTANLSHPKSSLGLGGFLIGYSVADVIMTVIDGAVATVFILFAEDPHSLTTSHPDSHKSLHETWQRIYPQEYENATKREVESV